MKTQKCTYCSEPSLPGILQGHGKCQYHWNAGVWGQEWADHVRDLDILNTVTTDNPVTAIQVGAAQRITGGVVKTSNENYQKAANAIYRYDMQGLQL